MGPVFVRSHGRRSPPDPKVMYLFLAVAKTLARWVEGDCHTLEATKSLVPVAPVPKFVFRQLTSTAVDCYYFEIALEA